jgi:hypothetical protein
MSAPREETFAVDAHSGSLLRRVTPRRGAPYEHACTKAVYDDVAYAIEQLGNASFTIEDVRLKAGGGDEEQAPPWTQVTVAVAFLKERGCIVPARERKHIAATDFVYEDALIEYHALREGSPGSAQHEKEG